MSYEKVVSIERAQYLDAHPEEAKPAEEAPSEMGEEAAAEVIDAVIEDVEEQKLSDK